ncbi:peptide chain release factor 1 (bRF-1) [Hydrogenispora ethanolica]|uniref:Peptide chain release factor 1 n=1 Tax=Hydrogenispora ethanolica TaxID=1082276 RepID=A0A4R1RM67_HYDET|nr:peptide chain release factor 1 [Hydrogenispora ethanolica]TCL67353.1 peptide chain release factor 1 (bRF-1) [Hydrogenispora ethanolica]
MLDKIAAIEEKYHELSNQLSDPAVIADQPLFQKLARAHAAISELVETYQEYKRVAADLETAAEMLREEQGEAAEMLRAEIADLEATAARLSGRLRILLLPRDPNDEKNAIIEIRAGTGGEEAALFAGDLFRMYTRYAESKGWRTELLSTSESDLGGFKEIIFTIEGQQVFSRLKFESGVHRVQRVPETEAQGRIHTSAATVAIMPEAEEVEVEIGPNDLRIDVFRAGGHGGQCVNTTDSAVRITHLPTGLVVTCQDEKSQLKNKEKAMKVLRARLLDKFQSEQHAEMAEARRNMVGSGDRSERIRTYNFPQNRLTDHRINLTLYHLDSIIEGNLDEVIEPLITADQAERLKNVDQQ